MLHPELYLAITLSGFCGFIQYYYIGVILLSNVIIMSFNWFICFLFLRAAKEQKRAAKATKKAVAPPKAKQVAKQKVAKVTQKSAPRVGGKR